MAAVCTTFKTGETSVHIESIVPWEMCFTHTWRQNAHPAAAARLYKTKYALTNTLDFPFAILEGGLVLISFAACSGVRRDGKTLFFAFNTGNFPKFRQILREILLQLE
jgi:hypothetical protein